VPTTGWAARGSDEFAARRHTEGLPSKRRARTLVRFSSKATFKQRGAGTSRRSRRRQPVRHRAVLPGHAACPGHRVMSGPTPTGTSRSPRFAATTAAAAAEGAGRSQLVVALILEAARTGLGGRRALWRERARGRQQRRLMGDGTSSVFRGSARWGEDRRALVSRYAGRKMKNARESSRAFCQ